jgi:hypothetical protein
VPELIKLKSNFSNVIERIKKLKIANGDIGEAQRDP